MEELKTIVNEESFGESECDQVLKIRNFVKSLGLDVLNQVELV